jgi:quercetin dioxygenase-like cupin family protein
MQPLRRVVAGLDAEGRSSIVLDGPSETVVWSTAEWPADNEGSTDMGGTQPAFPTTGTQFVFWDFPAGTTSRMHATNTIDYVVVLAGECVFVTEAGEARMQAGDVVVDRGVAHAWRNDGPEPCRIATVLCPARPVGPGQKLTAFDPMD